MSRSGVIPPLPDGPAHRGELTSQERRREVVKHRWLGGRAPYAIAQELAPVFKVTERQIRRYIEEVQAELKALPQPDPVSARERVEGIILNTIENAKLEGKWSVVAHASRTLAQLDGLLTERVQVTTEPEFDPSKLTDEELAQAEALKAKAKR